MLLPKKLLIAALLVAPSLRHDAMRYFALGAPTEVEVSLYPFPMCLPPVCAIINGSPENMLRHKIVTNLQRFSIE